MMAETPADETSAFASKGPATGVGNDFNNPVRPGDLVPISSLMSGLDGESIGDQQVVGTHAPVEEHQETTIAAFESGPGDLSQDGHKDLDWMTDGAAQTSVDFGNLSSEPLLHPDGAPNESGIMSTHRLQEGDGVGVVDASDLSGLGEQRVEAINDDLRMMGAEPQPSNTAEVTHKEVSNELPILLPEEKDPFAALKKAARHQPSYSFSRTVDATEDADFFDNETANTSVDLGRGVTKNVLLEEENTVTDWMAENEHVDNVEDSWAKAFADDPSLDDTWNAAFGEGLDDDGFLEEAPPSAIESTPQVQTSQFPSRRSSNRATDAAYTNVFSPPQSSIQPQQSSGPMKFFEELPVVQAKPRRGRAPTIQDKGPVPPPPPGPANAPRQVLPPSQNAYPQFRQPEKLDPFPPQTAVQQPKRSTASTSLSYDALELAPAPRKSRYSTSPAAGVERVSSPPKVPQAVPTQPIASQPAPSQYSVSPQFSPASQPGLSSQLAPPSNDGALRKPRSKSPYATAPAGKSGRYAASPQRSQPSGETPVPTPTAAPPPPPRPTGPGEARTMAVDRYSPVSQTTQGNVQGRTTSQPPPPVAQPPPFAPRTSSPLAQVDSLPETPAYPSATVFPTSFPTPPSMPNRYSPALTRNQNSKSVASAATIPSPFSPDFPPRPNTQSPETTKKPEHAHDRYVTQAPPVVSRDVLPVRPPAASRGSFHQRIDTDFAAPEDGTASDPLERWKGCPQFHWGPCGMVVTSFPKHLPRYGGGQAAPTIKSIAGEIKVTKLKELVPTDEDITAFPGPLKSKSKKKDVQAWLSTRINALEKRLDPTSPYVQDDQPGLVREKERCILWQALRILVEFDGNIANKPEAVTALRQMLSAHLTEGKELLDPTATQETSSAHSRHQSDARDPQSLGDIGKALALGDRNKAVWQAADNRLWGHAMLIASTMDRDIWKQVIQEFVRKEVRGPRRDTQSLAALYEVFAGNWQESIDELVPASARAGFHMIRTADDPNKPVDTLEGLNKWRETLLLVLTNRSNDDDKALVALGRLLASYGRIEAAHTCFLFARPAAVFSGADDPQADFSLLGANVLLPLQTPKFGIDEIMLTEVLEYAISLSAPNTSAYFIPHLQAYKLQHASILAESGYRNEAQQYCDAIAGALKSTTRLSPYYHPTLASQVDDLQRRLSSSPKDGNSWISKPTMGKVSSSMWAKFNSFVAGDEDTASQGSGAASEYEAGPFARMPGETPSISRQGSNGDLYGASGMPIANSRYAPSAPGDSPRMKPLDYGHTYHPRPTSSESNSSFSYGSPPGTLHFNRGPSNLSYTQTHDAANRYSPESFRSHPSASYEPYVPSVQEETQSPPQVPSAITPQFASIYGPPDQSQQSSPYGSSSYLPNNSSLVSPGAPEENYSDGANGFVPPAGNTGYDPAAGGGYEPPASGYQPYDPGNGNEEEESKPRKRGGPMDLDDDDDIASRSAALKDVDKARKDRENEEMVRRVAEEDAKRAEGAKANRSSWLGGWFGKGKPEPDMPTVHKAKLGEENSFYFDKNLGKWINKKGGSEQSSATGPAPPPPRIGSSSVRSASSTGAPSPPPSGGPPMGPPRMPFMPRSASAALPDTASIGSGSRPASRAGSASPAPSNPDGDAAAPPLQPPTSIPGGSTLAPPTGPPSRPSTSMSNASSIEDLIGGPAARKGGTVKKGKKARYVDVMAK